MRHLCLHCSTKLGDLSIDASARYDSGEARGNYAGAVTSTVDMNRDGVISVPEQNVVGIDHANSSPVNYDWSYSSYSIGANYQIDPSLATFARISKGGRANADRLLFGKVRSDGSVADEDAVDSISIPLASYSRSKNFCDVASKFCSSVSA